MSDCLEWIPALCRRKSQSYVWHIEKFREQQFRDITVYRRIGGRLHPMSEKVKGLRSSKFKMAFLRNGIMTKEYLFLLLTFESENQRHWLRLSLTRGDLFIHVDEKNKQPFDEKKICTAWISGIRKERMCTMTPSVESDDLLFTHPMFVCYSDLFDKEKGLLCSDSLTIVCELHALSNDAKLINSWLFYPIKPTVVENTENTLGNDLKRMIERNHGTDVTLVSSDGKEFPAHTLILASRSPVFAAMFEHDMKEKQERKVLIADLNSSTVEDLVHFMYTDTVESTVTTELLLAANKYQIPRLKTLCEEDMVTNLNIDNAAQCLFYAKLYDAVQLYCAAKHFIVRHFGEVRKTVW